MKKSFFWKISIPYILLILAAMAILGWLISSLYTKSVQQAMRDNLLAEAGMVANQAAEMISEGHVPELENAIIDQAKVAGARITIIQKDGLVLAESELNPSIMENHLDRPEVLEALEGRESAEIRFSNTVLERLLYAAVPIQANGEIIGIARLAVPIRSIEQNVQSINRIIWGTTWMIVLSVIAIAIIITGYSMQPLRKLTLLANQISKVDDTEKISVTPKDEIGQMTDAFHRMADGLDRQIQDFKQEQTKLSTILTTMTDGILLVNQEGMVELTNPAANKMFEINPEAQNSASLVEVVRDHQIIEMWDKCLKEQNVQTQTLEITPDRIFIQCVTAPLGPEMPGYVLILLQDFTQLRKLEVIRRDFVSNVSHELRTPLASLKAITETLQQGALKDKKASQKFVTMMGAEIDNLIQMVEEQLELSRIESGRVPLNLNTCRPYDLITDAQNRMKVQAERAGLELTIQCEDDLPNINVDGARIEQVLVNLIHNAIKFTPPRGKITVSAKRNEKLIIFMVKDSGIGISEQDLPRIFERFYKTDRARAGVGTGLGLSISKHIIETHHGQIWVESKPGDGSTFYFSINI